MNRLDNQRGAALVATLIIAMLLFPLGALVVFQARSDLDIEHNLRSEIEAFYVAEAGLEHAVADIQPGRSFDEILVGADGVAHTRDDGRFPFSEGAPAAFPLPPFHYDVQVLAAPNGMIRLQSVGVGLNGSTKVLEVLVARGRGPVTPAALYAEGDLRALELGDAFRLSGVDHNRSGSPPGAAAASSVPAMATPRTDVADAVRRQLRADTAQQLVGAGGTPSVAAVAALNLGAYAEACAKAPRAVRLTPSAPIDTTAFGTAATPQLVIIGGDLDVSGEVSGAGILVVGGTLHVTGTLTFSGLVLALNGIAFGPASNVVIRGTVWRMPGQDERLQLLGRGSIDYSSQTLADVDAAFPGILPHAAVVVGWQEPL